MGKSGICPVLTEAWPNSQPDRQLKPRGPETSFLIIYKHLNVNNDMCHWVHTGKNICVS